MTTVYRICRRLENGDVVNVAMRSSQKDAEDLIRSLRECWPGEYTIEKICSTNAGSSRRLARAQCPERIQ
jgi:hypothetical protein